MRHILVLSMLLLAGPAHALSLQEDMPNDAIVPDVGRLEGRVLAQLSCRELFDAAPLPTENVTLLVEAHAGHPGLVVTIPQTLVVSKDDCTLPTSGEIQVEIPVVVMGTPDVPGETPQEIRIDVEVEGGEKQSVSFQAVMAWTGLLEIQAPVRVKQGGPQKQITYELVITNHGNSLATVLFAADPTAQGDLVAPSPIVLESAAQGGEATTRTAHVIYSTPFKNGPNNVEETLTIRVQPVSTKDPALKGDETTIELVGRTEGVYVPGPSAILAPALLGLALLARRRS